MSSHWRVLTFNVRCHWSRSSGDIRWRDPLARADLAAIAARGFGDVIKTVVDVEREIMAIGAELHADEAAALLDDGSRQPDLWGINLYPDISDDAWIEFDSMTNVRPTRGNREVDVRRMLSGASGLRPDTVPGRWRIETRHRRTTWEVIVEPDTHGQLVVVITAYRVEP